MKTYNHSTFSPNNLHSGFSGSETHSLTTVTPTRINGLNPSGKKQNPYRKWLGSAKAMAILFIMGLFFLGTSYSFGAIAQRGTATTASGTSSASIAMPTGVVQGDVMIATISFYRSSGTGSLANATSTGWTVITGSTLGGNSQRWGTVLYKIAGASEAGPYSFASSGSTASSAAGTIVAFSGVDVSPFDVTPGSITQSGSTTSTSASATAVTTVTANDEIVMCGMGVGTSTAAANWTTWTATTPATLTELSDFGPTGTNTAFVGVAAALKTTTGSTGAGAVTVISSANGGLLIALKPLATTYTSTGTGGNWSNAATWDLGVVPPAGSNVVIATGAPVTLDVSTGALSSLTINSQLDASNNAYTITGTGTLTIASTGTLLVGGTFPSGFATNTLNATSTVNYNGAAQTVSNQTYGNLTLSGSGAKTLTSGMSVAGSLTLSGTDRVLLCLWLDMRLRLTVVHPSPEPSIR